MAAYASQDGVLEDLFNKIEPDTTASARIGKHDRAERMIWAHVAKKDLGVRWGAFSKACRSFAVPGKLVAMNGATVGTVRSMQFDGDGLYIAGEIEDAASFTKVEAGVLPVISFDWGNGFTVTLADRPVDRAKKFADWKEARYLAREAALGMAPSQPAMSGAAELLRKSEVVGFEAATRLNPDLVERVKSEPLPVDLLPSARLQLMALRSGYEMSDLLKMDYGLQQEYDLEMVGQHRLQRVESKRLYDDSCRNESLRKSVTSSGRVPVAEVEVVVDGVVVTDAVTKGAWIGLARLGHARARGLTFRARGAELRPEDIQS